MSTQYITIKSKDPDFKKYLWGSFDRQKKAIPIKSYNLGTKEESVTFEIKKNSEINKPSLFLFLAALLKLKSFLLILMPLFFVLVKNYKNDNFDVISMLSAALASIFLFAGLNIKNDVNDHISGYDRVNLDLTPRPIREGWVSAEQASYFSLLFVVLAGVSALPALLLNLHLLSLLGGVFFLFVLGQLAKKNSYKNQHFGEFVLFILIGPALVSGFQMSAGGRIDQEVALFGVLWGLGVLFLIQINNFSHIMTSSQNHIRNTITKLGFDLAQKFLIFCWSVFLTVWFVFQFQYHNNYLGWGGSLLLVIISVKLFSDVLNIKSPMGSGLQKIRIKAYRVFFICEVILFTQCLVQLRVFG